MTKKLFLIAALALTIVSFGSPVFAAQSLGCFIDTPAFDPTTIGQCTQIGSSSTTAVFDIVSLSHHSGYTISWSVSGCSGLVCFVPISPGQSKTVAVRVTNNSTGVTDSAVATATYYFEPGF